jgi:2-methylcitrate dehydratase PrpD
VHKLGSEFDLIDLSFKPWPACALAHTYIDAMLNLRSEHSLHAEDIEEIDVYSGEVSRELCNPIDMAAGKYPKTTNDGKRSIPFSVALAALTGKVSLKNFTDEGLRDPEVLKVAEKVKWISAPELEADSFKKKGNQLPPGKVSVTDKRGRTFTKVTEFPYGHHFNPIKFDDLVDKFRDCLGFARKSIPVPNRERVIDMILNLENVSDIREILRMLA